MTAQIREILAWTRNPPDYTGGPWTASDIRDVMISKGQAIWAGYSYQEWYERLLESRLRRALDGTFKRDRTDPFA